MTNPLRFSLGLLALVLVLPLAGCMESGPASAVKEFYRHIEKGEVDEAADMFSGDLMSLIGREKMMAALSEQTREIAEKGGIDSFEFLSEEILGQVADLKVRVVYGNGESEESEIKLTKVDGEWKLTPEK